MDAETGVVPAQTKEPRKDQELQGQEGSSLRAAGGSRALRTPGLQTSAPRPPPMEARDSCCFKPTQSVALGARRRRKPVPGGKTDTRVETREKRLLRAGSFAGCVHRPHCSQTRQVTLNTPILQGHTAKKWRGTKAQPSPAGSTAGRLAVHGLPSSTACSLPGSYLESHAAQGCRSWLGGRGIQLSGGAGWVEGPEVRRTPECGRALVQGTRRSPGWSQTQNIRSLPLGLRLTDPQ